MQLIPAIDLRGGRCVRLRRGDFDAQTDYGSDLLSLAQQYRRWGAGWLHVVDLDGARAGAPVQLEQIRQLARTPGLAIQAGGGIRSREDLDRVFAAGASRAIIGSRAISDRDTVADWLTRYGAARIVLALDVRGPPRAPLIYTSAWTERSGESLWEVLAWYLQRADLQHVLCTDIARDGMLTGPNLELYTNARARFPQLRWQASGGICSGADLIALAALGVAGAISGTALLEGRLDPMEIRSYLPNA